MQTTANITEARDWQVLPLSDLIDLFPRPRAAPEHDTQRKTCDRPFLQGVPGCIKDTERTPTMTLTAIILSAPLLAVWLVNWGQQEAIRQFDPNWGGS